MIGIESGKHFACAAFVRTTGVTIIPFPLQRLHGFGYNGIVRIHLSTWLVFQLEGSVHSVPRDVTLPSLDSVLRESPRGFITVKNTEKRVAELLQCIEQILCQDRVTKTVAVSLKGRLGFAQGQIFGRTMRRLINELTAVSLGQERGDPLSENVKRTLREVSALFKDARPRKVSAFTNEVCYIFTDASFEPESCEGGIGAVLVSPQGTIVSWFSHMLSKGECRPFMRRQRQCICELEAVTILAAIRMWKHVVAARHTIFFVDNEGSRFAILRNWSQNEILAQISFRPGLHLWLVC